MAQFNDTTNLTGLINIWEFWTRNPAGATTGTLLKQATQRINAGFERIMPLLLAYNDQIRWDDTNNTDAPIGYVNLVQNQNDYKILTDDNSLSILNITKVRVLASASGTQYYELKRITSDDPQVADILDPLSTWTGTPSAYVELGNTIYLNVLPGYSATNGIEIFFGRQQVYFTSTDTTATPGIPLPFHELLALYAALDWNMVNRTADGALIQRLENRINEIREDLYSFINLRNPSKAKLSMEEAPTFI